jgi:hypothetical protein
LLGSGKNKEHAKQDLLKHIGDYIFLLSMTEEVIKDIFSSVGRIEEMIHLSHFLKKLYGKNNPE